ncbi:SpoIIE family protein phosphatase [Thiobacter aerophilum]|uniref:SpoIIE family protein phosphatase n=1 Tax=Thiobacter aerophilum TaxID=3121275 RepID=A0ABV0EDB3_9BURK
MTAPTLLDSSACKLLFADAIGNESAGILLRSRLQSVARRLGFADARRENMVLVASEMVTNLIKHAHGRGVLQIWQQPGNVLDLLSFDYGPGVENPSLAQADGFSTAGTLGKGLGSMQRLADRFGLFSQRPSREEGRWHGTAVWCRFEPGSRPPARYEVGLFVRSLADDRHNGDHIYLHEDGERLRLLHLDGLGHGAEAAYATSHLARQLAEAESLPALVDRVDRQLRSTTRGAVAIACELLPRQRRLTLMGVGDMAGHVCRDGTVDRYAFAPGVLGREHKTPRPVEVALEPGAVLVSTSDGIRRGWDEKTFPGLCRQHPQLVAYVLGNSMARLTDDQSVCVLRYN